MNQKIKKFDSVQLMRKLRDQLNEEMAQMSPEERNPNERLTSALHILLINHCVAF